MPISSSESSMLSSTAHTQQVQACPALVTRCIAAAMLHMPAGHSQQPAGEPPCSEPESVGSLDLLYLRLWHPQLRRCQAQTGPQARSPLGVSRARHVAA